MLSLEGTGKLSKSMCPLNQTSPPRPGSGECSGPLTTALLRPSGLSSLRFLLLPSGPAAQRRDASTPHRSLCWPAIPAPQKPRNDSWRENSISYQALWDDCRGRGLESEKQRSGRKLLPQRKHGIPSRGDQNTRKPPAWLAVEMPLSCNHQLPCCLLFRWLLSGYSVWGNCHC